MNKLMKCNAAIHASPLVGGPKLAAYVSKYFFMDMDWQLLKVL